jgi:F-type H+-transporting ATPase subunit b
MNFNATLLVQSLTFLVFVFGMWRYAWPPIIKAMQARQAKIADGLSAAERAQQALLDASNKRDEELKAARAQAHDIVAAANKQSTQLIEAAKAGAEAEKSRIIDSAHAETEREIERAKETLRRQVGELAVAGASKILKREIDAGAHAELINDLAAKV